MAEPTQSKAPNYAQEPKLVLPEQKPKEAQNPFVLKDGKILVNKTFVEQNKAYLTSVAEKHGLSPEEYLGSVAKATIAKPYANKSWVGQSAR